MLVYGYDGRYARASVHARSLVYARALVHARSLVCANDVSISGNMIEEDIMIKFERPLDSAKSQR